MSISIGQRNVWRTLWRRVEGIVSSGHRRCGNLVGIGNAWHRAGRGQGHILAGAWKGCGRLEWWERHVVTPAVGITNNGK
jgi:hypothetical protein